MNKKLSPYAYSYASLIGCLVGGNTTLLVVRPALGLTGDTAAAIVAAATGAGALLSMLALWLFARYSGRTVDFSELEQRPITARSRAVQVVGMVLMLLAIIGLYAVSKNPTFFVQFWQ